MVAPFHFVPGHGPHLLANVFRCPRICMGESSFAIFQRKTIQILFKLRILLCYTNIIIRLHFSKPNSDKKWLNLTFLLLSTRPYLHRPHSRIPPRQYHPILFPELQG